MKLGTRRWLCFLGLHKWMGCTVHMPDGSQYEDIVCKRCLASTTRTR